MEELIATHGDPRILAGALVASGLFDLYKRFHPNGAATAVPARSRVVPDNVFATPMSGGAASAPLTLRNREKRAPPSPDEQDSAAARLGHAAASAIESKADAFHDVAIDVSPAAPGVERMPRPVRFRPTFGDARNVAAAIGAAGGVAGTYTLGSSSASSSSSSSPPSVDSPSPSLREPPITPEAAAQPAATPTPPVGNPTSTPGWMIPGSPVGRTSQMEMARQTAQIPGKSSGYRSGTWVMPRRGAYTRNLWYELAAGNASKMLAT
jgi:hypothetical protein